VTVRGEIRKAYRVQAQANELNIKQYHVIIIKPSGGTLVPFVVYSLETPEHFPALPDKNLDGKTLDLGDVVEVTGYFFKSWAHPGGDGKMHSSPLMLTKNFDWYKGERLEATAKAQATDSSVSNWVILGIPLTLAVVISVSVYLASIWNNDESRTRSKREDAKNSLAQLNDDEVGPSVLESLGDLASQELPPTTSPAGSDIDESHASVDNSETYDKITEQDSEESTDNEQGRASANE